MHSNGTKQYTFNCIALGWLSILASYQLAFLAQIMANNSS